MYIYTQIHADSRFFYTRCVLNLNKIVISENNDKFSIKNYKLSEKKKEEKKIKDIFLYFPWLFITIKVKFNLYANNKLRYCYCKCHVLYNLKNVNYKSMSKEVIIAYVTSHKFYPGNMWKLNYNYYIFVSRIFYG